jgi:hypothetical protein
VGINFRNWAILSGNYLLPAALLLAVTSSAQVPFIKDPDTPMSTHRMILRAHESELHITKSEWKQLVLHLDFINRGTEPLHLIDGQLPLASNIVRYRVSFSKKIGNQYTQDEYLGEYAQLWCENCNSVTAPVRELTVNSGESKKFAVQVFKYISKEPDIGRYNIEFYFNTMIDDNFVRYNLDGVGHFGRQGSVNVYVKVIR